MVIIWSAPLVVSWFATSFAVIGARDLSFLSCLAYGKLGIRAVTRCAEAILQALIIISSSIKWSFIDAFTPPLLPSLQHPVYKGDIGSKTGWLWVTWTIKTSSPRTDSWISTLVSPFANLVHFAFETGIWSLLQISRTSSGWEEPPKTLMLDILNSTNYAKKQTNQQPHLLQVRTQVR